MGILLFNLCDFGLHKVFQKSNPGMNETCLYLLWTAQINETSVLLCERWGWWFCDKKSKILLSGFMEAANITITAEQQWLILSSIFCLSEHSNNDNHGNQGVIHSIQGCNYHAVLHIQRLTLIFWPFKSQSSHWEPEFFLFLFLLMPMPSLVWGSVFQFDHEQSHWTGHRYPFQPIKVQITMKKPQGGISNKTVIISTGTYM